MAKKEPKKERKCDTALLWAAANGHSITVTWLIERLGAKVEVADEGGRTALILAAMNGHTKVVTRLVERHEARVEAADEHGTTSLMWAARNGHTETLSRLIYWHSARVEAVDENGRTALICAAGNGQTETAKTLIRHHQADVKAVDENGRTALMWAATYGHVETVTLITQQGLWETTEVADEHGRTALILAAMNGHTEIVSRLIERHGAKVDASDKYGTTALMLAAGNGHAEMARRLIQQHGAKVSPTDHLGRTALILAAMNGHTEIVSRLIERHGAKVDAGDKYGTTALMLAAGNGHIMTSKTLIERHGASIDDIDKDGDTPLTLAAYNGHLEIVTRLIEQYGARVEACGRSGWTALICAAGNGHTETATRLIERHGASVDAVDQDGMTALMWAAGNGHTETAVALTKYGARIEAIDQDGMSALTFASDRGHENTAAELRRLRDLAAERFVESNDVATGAPLISSTDHSTSVRIANDANLTNIFMHDFSMLEVYERLGEGSFGVVYRGTWQGTDVAVKFLSLADRSDATSTSSDLDPSFIQESAIMAGLRHPHIVQFLGMSPTGTRSDQRPCIVTEFCARGGLNDVLRKARSDEVTAGELTWSRRLTIALGAAKGMLYLHNLQPAVLHRDLKSPNLLITDNWSVKVADFGLSKLSELVDERTSMSTVRTINPRWLAPELLRGEGAGRASDVFSFGIIMWELLTWQTPWGAGNMYAIAGEVAQGGRLAVPGDRRTLPGPDNDAFQGGLDDYIALMRRCWSHSPRERPGFEYIVRSLEDLLATLCHPENPMVGRRRTTRDDTRQLCCICFENTPNVRMHPCGHTACRHCSTAWLERQGVCHVCRQPIADRHDLYL